MLAEPAVPDNSRPAPLRDCLVCETTAAAARELAAAKTGRKLVACGNCGFTYAPLTAPPLAAGAATHPGDALLGWVDRTTSWRRFMFSMLQPHELLNHLGPGSGNVVDVGCHRETLKSISRRFSIYGLETFPELSARARTEAAQSGATILSTTAVEGLSRFPDRSLAGVMLHSHLERDADARRVVELLSRKLRLDGIAILKLSNYGSINRRIMGKRWYKFNFPEYLNYFRRCDVTALASCFGLEASFPFLLSLPTDDNFVAILKPKIPAEIY
ncbi:methionine biosynthesis protein MetW [Acidocella sp.]|uniref:methionine biosynthesis protein MetW n=1 Tax=Acidocella sp. TaxID=50710 RepID=UPI00261E8CD7|nr:methionine biosynthesis protein MetW [Acidocella sp.]MDD2795674.1 methionine biosynthesis protein MetW [Acidocella sp.]